LCLDVLFFVCDDFSRKMASVHPPQPSLRVRSRHRFVDGGKPFARARFGDEPTVFTASGCDDLARPTDRAVLMQATASHTAVNGARLALRSPLPERFEGGAWGENVLVDGDLTTLCVGDILAVRPALFTRSSDTVLQDIHACAAPPSTLRLQVASPRRPCAKVDGVFGKTWGAAGVRAHTAPRALAGCFLRVLEQGELSDGDELVVLERRWAQWPLWRVARMLYGMEGACDSPSGYSLPGKGTASGGTAKNARGGGRALVRHLWQGTEAELRELASMPELARQEWRDEFEALVAAWDGRGCPSLCGRAVAGAIAMLLVGVIMAGR
jgi:MOSC domain-containing protein YiiM